LFVSEQYRDEIVSEQFRAAESAAIGPFVFSQITRIEGETEGSRAPDCFASTTLGALFLTRFSKMRENAINVQCRMSELTISVTMLC
jgi:hypothetical protein